MSLFENAKNRGRRTVCTGSRLIHKHVLKSPTNMTKHLCQKHFLIISLADLLL